MVESVLVSAIDADDMFMGNYSVDPDTKFIPARVGHVRTVPAPDEPLPTGELDGEGNPILEWPDTTWANVPTAGNNGGWQKRKGKPQEHGPWSWDEGQQEWVRL